MTKERKPTVWSRHRIEQLIELYRKQECLWNPWNEFYKNKGKRNKAIENICSALNVSKPEFAKKIHNLRNQFNSEVKKYEKLLEEAEELEENETNEYQCRWVHYQSLMFLKDVIAPRPGIAQNVQKNKRIRLETNPNNSSNALISADDIFIEETNLDDNDDPVDNDDFGGFEDHESSDNSQNIASKEDTREIITLTHSKASPTKYFTRLHPPTPFQLKQGSQQIRKASSPVHSLTAGTVIELNTPGPVGNISAEKQTPISSSKMESRDQWSAFGEFIANEIRNYQSDLSRRKLKRRILQAMLEVSEEDDALGRSKHN